MSRFTKQLIYGAIYLAILAGLGWFGYRWFVPAPTCTDGVQNGTEEGIDCGAVCGRSCPLPIRPLTAAPVALIENSDGSWDALIQFDNPNGAYGAASFDYSVAVADATGTALAARHGQTYAQPGQPQYLVFPLGKLASAPASAQLQFDANQIQWASLAIDAAGSVEFALRGDALDRSENSVRFAASVTNRSAFDFDVVDVTVLLSDATGRIVGAGSTVIRTLRAGQERGFVVDWPFIIPSAVRAQAFIGTNLFANDNYLQQYGGQEQFQGF